jgi:hypothetical protein
VIVEVELEYTKCFAWSGLRSLGLRSPVTSFASFGANFVTVSRLKGCSTKQAAFSPFTGPPRKHVEAVCTERVTSSARFLQQ